MSEAESHEPKPTILYRAFTVNPENLNVEMFNTALVPGTKSETVPNAVADGNEYGVYMSTNQQMVETAYAHSNIAETLLRSQQYTLGRGQEFGIKLPQCGIVVEINTDQLAIRKPKITQALQGHYNNGFVGEEWIADTIPPNYVKVKKLILSRMANDPEKIVREIDPNDPEDLQHAIDEIKTIYQTKKERALQLVEEINALPSEKRMNQFAMSKLFASQQRN